MTHNLHTENSPNAIDPRLAFRRYADLVAHQLATISGPTTFSTDTDFTQENQSDPSLLQVERGCIFPRLILDSSVAAQRQPAIEKLIASTFADGKPADLDALHIIDRSGACRRIYRPILVYSWLCAFRMAYEKLPRAEFGRWENALLLWAESLAMRISEFTWPAKMLTAPMGSGVAETCWSALALYVAGKVFIRDGFTDLAGDVFGKLLACQTDAGPFLSVGASDNIETTTYDELCILHAAASYAVQSENRSLARGIVKATQFHLNETQPDHATNQPLGLFAFIWNPQTHAIADTLLHAAESQAGNSSGLTAILLGDVAECLQLFRI